MTAQSLARYALSFSWVYHGLFPKILFIAPIEKAMTASLNFSEQTSYWITKCAGISEIFIGIIVFVFYKSTSIIWLNILALFALLTFVAVQLPHLLIEAFNPMTTNLLMIVLSLILLTNINNESIND